MFSRRCCSHDDVTEFALHLFILCLKLALSHRHRFFLGAFFFHSISSASRDTFQYISFGILFLKAFIFYQTVNEGLDAERTSRPPKEVLEISSEPFMGQLLRHLPSTE